MKMNPPILFQKFAHQLGFMSREIIQDDVNLPAPGAQRDDFLEEGEEVAAGMASAGFAVNPAGGGVQGCVQRECSVTEVFEPVAFGPSRREGQNRIEPIQRLNGGASSTGRCNTI